MGWENSDLVLDKMQVQLQNTLCQGLRVSIGEAGRGGGAGGGSKGQTCGQCVVKPKGIANSQHLLPNAHLARFPKLHGLQGFLHHPFRKLQKHGLTNMKQEDPHGKCSN